MSAPSLLFRCPAPPFPGGAGATPDRKEDSRPPDRLEMILNLREGRSFRVEGRPGVWTLSRSPETGEPEIRNEAGEPLPGELLLELLVHPERITPSEEDSDLYGEARENTTRILSRVLSAFFLTVLAGGCLFLRLLLEVADPLDTVFVAVSTLCAAILGWNLKALMAFLDRSFPAFL